MLVLTSGELFVADYEFQLHSCALSQKEKGEMFTAENKKPLTQMCKGLFLYEIIGGQYKIRTCDLQLRRLTLYPTELIARAERFTIHHCAHLSRKNSYIS